jgi:hypothetical protein
MWLHVATLPLLYTVRSILMEHDQLVVRLLKEVATARTAIAAGYMRLWNPGRPSTGGGGPDATRGDAELRATRDPQSTRDDGER